PLTSIQCCRPFEHLFLSFAFNYKNKKKIIILFQIFPEINLDESDSTSYPEDFLYRRERLPSIVVEPTELSELETGELSWAPQYQMSNSVEEEEDSSVDNTEGSVDGEQQEDVGLEGR
uniref:LBH domain-containing protein n=1 Tax=Anabas testudineus TaxID=64144 RepID=A0A3Q1IKW4_ANATE